MLNNKNEKFVYTFQKGKHYVLRSVFIFFCSEICVSKYLFCVVIILLYKEVKQCMKSEV